jgi:hypothetical protein
MQANKTTRKATQVLLESVIFNPLEFHPSSSTAMHDPWLLNYISVPQIARQYTLQPPEFKSWGGCEFEGEPPQDHASYVEEQSTTEGEGLAAPKVDIGPGTRVECLFTLDGADAEWYAGEVVSENKVKGTWHIKFDDEQEEDIEYSDPELRLESAGPWTTWLDTYLPRLLLSAYRAARRTPTDLDERFFEVLQKPELFSGDTVPEFQPRNFCDVVNLCENDSEDSSLSSTPAKFARR